MLYTFTGDRDAMRKSLDAAIAVHLKVGAQAFRLNDANSLEDVRAALSERGMFETGERTVVLDGIFSNEEMRTLMLELLPSLAASDDHIFIVEEKTDASLRAKFEKFATESKKFEGVKKEKEDNFFGIVNALQKKQKKELWVLLQRELALGKAPEMMHGALFWAAKQLVLKSRAASESARGKKLVAELAILPHEARRQGEELEYALERFVLSGM